MKYMELDHPKGETIRVLNVSTSILKECKVRA